MKAPIICELTTRYNTRKSFSGKALVLFDHEKNTTILYSYTVPVAARVNYDIVLLPHWDESRTTISHVREFIRQFDYRYLDTDMTKQQISETFRHENVE